MEPSIFPPLSQHKVIPHVDAKLKRDEPFARFISASRRSSFPIRGMWEQRDYWPIWALRRWPRPAPAMPFQSDGGTTPLVATKRWLTSAASRPRLIFQSALILKMVLETPPRLSLRPSGWPRKRGLAGGSIEDLSGRANIRTYELQQAADRVRAAAEVVPQSSLPVSH